MAVLLLCDGDMHLVGIDMGNLKIEHEIIFYILLEKSEVKGICFKVADIGLIVIHKYSEQSHAMDKGTSENMVPEDFTDEKYDTKADIYSLGVIFQELFALEMIE